MSALASSMDLFRETLCVDKPVSMLHMFQGVSNLVPWIGFSVAAIVY